MSETCHCNNDCCEQKESRYFLLRCLISVVLLAIALFCEHRTSLDRMIVLAIYILSYLFVGLGVIKEAIEEMKKGDFFSEFTLMSVASIGAFIIGEYPEGVAVMLLYCVGEYIQDKAVDRVRGNIQSLLDLKPTKVRVKRADALIDTTPKDVQVGETISVRLGERVPLDGILCSADQIFADTSALTGESEPRPFNNGDEILSGMILVGIGDSTTDTSKGVELRVLRCEEESAISRVLKLVEDASDRKAPTELFIRRFARIYTPVMMIIALCIVLFPLFYSLIFSAEFKLYEWVYRALMFLVISCPCAIVISIPLCYFAGIGAGAKHGVLFKGGNYLDSLGRVGSIYFDKTGTLTNPFYLSDQNKKIFNEKVKDDSLQTIDSLKQMGIDHLEILSGDTKEKVEVVANALGIERYNYDLKPSDKLEIFLREERVKNRVKIFVGDGINDAPLLRAADVGVAMGAMGADLAIESADVIIQTDQPSKIVSAIKIAHYTNRIAKQNITLALGFKILVLILGMVGIASLGLAVFADSGIAVVAVLNSLRIKQKRY